ncbi:MAG: hypothetical protein OHK0029_29290 [Armatimonadaceae bacterium]
MRPVMNGERKRHPDTRTRTRTADGAETSSPLAHHTGYFCPVCGHEFLPEEIGKKPYCRRCGYLES